MLLFLFLPEGPASDHPTEQKMSSVTVNLSLSLSLVGNIWSGSGSDTGYSQQTVDVHHVCSLSTHSATSVGVRDIHKP